MGLAMPVFFGLKKNSRFLTIIFFDNIIFKNFRIVLLFDKFSSVFDL